MQETDQKKRRLSLTAMADDREREHFGFLLTSLEHGAPPHGGIALGFDRIIMFLVGTDSSRDVIAFPKTQKAADLMMRAPAHVDDLQLRELGIRLRGV